ncbi:hypothetical protein ACFTZK_19280 [Streptomyces decoyicus]|uniref:hypothetical protein n=1 Tax=Streptomyces decoyicus TaxID=249567 RepID=UPI00363017F3
MAPASALARGPTVVLTCEPETVRSFVDDGVRERFTTRLRDDLDSGVWDQRFGRLRSQAFYEGSLVLVRATPQDNEEHRHERT